MIEGDRSLTYDHYGRVVRGLSDQLRQYVQPGERVALCVPNSLEANIAVFAALDAGAEIALINVQYTAREIDPLFAMVTPRLVVAAKATESVAKQCAGNSGATFLTIGEGPTSIEELRKNKPERPQLEIDPESAATIVFTGGTTGVPKGVERSHRLQIGVIRAMHSAWPTRLQGEVSLNVAPMSHVWGLHMGCFNPVYDQSTLVIVPRYHPGTVLRSLIEHRVSVFSGGPSAIYQGLLSCPDLSEADLSALWICPGGGSVFSQTMLSQWEASTGVPILEAYGMTEGGPLTAQPLDGTHKLGTAGVPLPETEVAIVALDGSGKRLPPNENGEILVRGERVVNQYMGMPPVAPDGWLPTGDIGFLDEDGFLTLVDRKKEMLIVGGFNVFPSEIEEVLSKYPGVHEVAVVSVEDSRKGEVPVAYVSLLPNANVDEEALAVYCAKNLAGFKVPRDFIILDELPKTHANKIDKRVLKERGGRGPSGARVT